MEASDVNVKIVTTQTADGESETFCTETDGTLYRRDDSGFSLAYTEPDEELFGSETSVTLCDGVLTVERGDALTLTIAPGQRTDGVYRMPFGSMPMCVGGKELTFESGDDYLYVHAVYTLETEGQLISENDIKLTVQLLYADSLL